MSEDFGFYEIIPARRPAPLYGSYATIENRCAYSVWTNRKWCDCNVNCVEVECWNRDRIAEGRTDGASHHTLIAREFRDDAHGMKKWRPFALTRSRYCCAQHCVDFIPANVAPKLLEIVGYAKGELKKVLKNKRC